MRKSKKSNPMIINMIKGDVRVELVQWPPLLLRLEVDMDVELFENHRFRVAQPFMTLSEICHRHHVARGSDSPSLGLLKELEATTLTGGMYPLNDLIVAGWSVKDSRRLEAA